ncbi:MAG: Ig-like domain-containing protein, partial [Methylophilaceae bacterium]|nr:Ig-like domain-containing protein [Methylophilaceae bacterium]
MARAISYFVFSGTGSYTRWADDPTISRYQMSITGGGSVDRLYAGAGTQVDATGLFASAGVDQFYLSGNFGDYMQTVSSSGVYTFTGLAVGSHAGEVMSFSMTSSGDKLVFADYSVMLYLGTYLNTQTNNYATIQSSQLTPSSQPVPSLGAVPGDAPSKVFVFDAGGVNIPQLPIVGEAIAITGGGGVDSFYVRKGTNADALGLFASSGIDVLYLTGRFTDYNQTVSTSGVYTFTRTFTAADVGLSEVVSFSMTSSGDKLVFADGGVTLQLSNYLSGGAFAPILSSSLGPSLTGTEYVSITNMDVRSNLVLVASENIQSAVANKFIRIVDDGGGYRGEAINNTLTIAANSTMVSISGNKVIINPDVDLDLASNYHIEIDDGAFMGSSGRALSWITRGGFSTVTPSTGATGAQAVRMNSAGTIENSSLWLDLEGRGDPAQALAAANTFNANNASYVFYVADSDPTTPTNSGSGVKTNSAFNVSIVGLGSDDQVYFDNLGVNQSINQASNISLANNRLTLSSLFSNGGQINFSLAGAALPAAALALPAPEAVASIPANAIPPSTVIDLNSLLGANVVFAESAPVLTLVSTLRMTVAGSTSAMQTTNQNTAISVRGQSLQATQVQLFSDANENGVFDASEAIGSLINVDASGNWSTTINLPEGKSNLRARVLYANAPTQISPLSVVVVDTTPPVPSIALAVDAGANASDGITNNSAIALFGLESGTTWVYQVDGAGTWLPGIGQQLNAQNGTHTYRVRYTDLAGNSATSNALTVTLDTTTPATPQSAVMASTISVAGLEVNATWQYRVDGGAWLAGTATGFSASAGSHSYQVRQTDLAGNASASTDASILYLPTPTVYSGYINTLTPTNIVPGATWQYSIDGGAWTNSSEPRLRLSSGQHSYSVRQVFSGSTSQASAALSASPDNTAPTITSVELSRASDGATNATL